MKWASAEAQEGAEGVQCSDHSHSGSKILGAAYDGAVLQMSMVHPGWRGAATGRQRLVHMWQVRKPRDQPLHLWPLQ